MAYSREDIRVIRAEVAQFDPSASTAVTGEDRAKIEEIFAPVSHGKALDPATTLVLGARGAGKSFWASVMLNDDTRALADQLYPRLRLNSLNVRVGYGGIGGQGVTKAVVDKLVPEASDSEAFWRAVIAKEARLAAGLPVSHKVSDVLQDLADPEDWQDAMAEADTTVGSNGKRVLVIFDALDTLSGDWERLRELVDGLMRVVWELRGLSSIRAKLFMRPDQLDELLLRFVELSKLRSGAARLEWRGRDLFGMMFARLAFGSPDVKAAFVNVLSRASLPQAPAGIEGLQDWALTRDEAMQRILFEQLAGPYMGAGPRKGRTYDWPFNHLADGHDEVTPRSFLILMQRAAASTKDTDRETRVLSSDAIRDGLREASRVRIDQLSSEYPWITRVLLPLAGLRVPAAPDAFWARWQESGTVDAATKLAERSSALPPIPAVSELPPGKYRREVALGGRLAAMGVLISRNDGRFDMPDLFRVGAALLKKGGVAPGR